MFRRMSAEDFSEDITNGGFEMQGNSNDELMGGDDSKQDSFGQNGGAGGGEAMEHSYRDSGTADHHGRDDDRYFFS